MFWNAIILAIIVSIDGFFSGFAIGINKTRINFIKLLIIASIPVLMGIPVMLFGIYISDFINTNIANYIGAGIFIFLAISSFLEIHKNEDNNIIKYNEFISVKLSILVGFTLGIDSSIGAFSLAIQGHNAFITPLYFGIFHGLFVFLGNKLALFKNIQNINKFKYLSPILFILIAISKIL